MTSVNTLSTHAFKKVSLLVLCFLLQSSLAHSQSPRQSTDDSIRAGELNNLSKSYWRKNLDSSVYYARQALKISEASNYKRGIAEAYRNIGATNLFAGDPDVASANLMKALALYQELSDAIGLAATYNNLGVLHSGKSEFATASIFLDSALKFFRKSGNKEGEGSVLNYIGINYQDQGDYQKAIDYCLQGYELRKSINDHQGVVFSLINVGNMYLAVGQAQRALNFYDQSVSYARDNGMPPADYSLMQIGRTYLKLNQFDKARSFMFKMINGRMEAIDHLGAGELYQATGNLDKAIAQYQISLEQTPDKKNKILALIGLGKVYLMKNDLRSADVSARSAYKLAESINNKLLLADASGVLAELHKRRGEYETSLRLFEMSHSILDGINNEDYQHKLAFTESKNEIENQQAKVKLLSTEKKLEEQKLKDEKTLRQVILGVFAVAAIAGFMIIRTINRKRSEIQSQRDQIELQSVKVEKAYDELKSTQAMLVQKEKMASLGELVAGIAHEIQNPLNFVKNFSELNTELLEDLRQERSKAHRDFENEESILTDIKENEQKISHHGKRAGSIVEGMLKHSRQSHGLKVETDINALADEYLRLSYQGVRSKDNLFHAVLKTNFDQSIKERKVISQDIGTVLLNIYNNAFYAVREKAQTAHGVSENEVYKPTVSVNTKTIGENIEIRVRDNGNGIPQHLITKIFQPFFTTKPAGQGTGLGLSLSYDIIKAHGGEISVESIEGEFTQFTVVLPA